MTSPSQSSNSSGDSSSHSSGDLSSRRIASSPKIITRSSSSSPKIASSRKIITRSHSRKMIEEFRMRQKKAKVDGSDLISMPGVALFVDHLLAEYRNKEYEYKIYQVKHNEGDEAFYITFGQLYAGCAHSSLKEAEADLSPLASDALWGMMRGDEYCYAFPNAKICRYRFRDPNDTTMKILKVHKGKVRINLEGYS